MQQSLILPPDWLHRHLVETDSTMNRIREIPPESIPQGGGVLVSAGHQTAGHGQKGTHWEADVDANLLFSFAIRPQGIAAACQFSLSEALALAVAESLATLVGECTVKWPNDVYWHNRKICGMLLEHTIAGENIVCTRVGVGINVNQQSFSSNAPNPVSVFQIKGQMADCSALLGAVISRFTKYLHALQQGAYDALHANYMQHLYRRDGHHAFRDAEGHTFDASIESISPLGVLTLAQRDGRRRSSAFKEVAFCL